MRASTKYNSSLVGTSKIVILQFVSTGTTRQTRLYRQLGNWHLALRQLATGSWHQIHRQLHVTTWQLAAEHLRNSDLTCCFHLHFSQLVFRTHAERLVLSGDPKRKRFDLLQFLSWFLVALICRQAGFSWVVHFLLIFAFMVHYLL